MSDVIREKVCAFVLQSLQEDVLDDDEDMYALGYANSLFTAQLVVFLEKNFHISLQKIKGNLADLHSIDAIVAFVEGAQAG